MSNYTKKMAYEAYQTEMDQIEEELENGIISQADYNYFARNLNQNLKIDLEEIERDEQTLSLELHI